jgi:hypothetical protein
MVVRTMQCGAMVLIATGIVAADTITVDRGESIQDAIDGAANGDLILVAAGTFAEPLDFGGRSVVVQASGGAGVTTIDAGGADTAVRFVNGEGFGSRLIGFTVRGGDAANGGGVRIDGSSPIIVDCIIASCTATVGGGMRVQGNSSPLVLDTSFDGNSADFGGGVSVRDGATPEFIGCWFSGNTARFGGGIENRNGASPRIERCEFLGNTASTGSGAGLYSIDSAPRVIRSRFDGNVAELRSGGGMLIVDSDARVTNCVFVGNGAGENGGGAYSDGGAPQFTNCLFDGNVALFGGGMYSTMQSDPVITNCTLVDNVAGSSGGGMISLFGASALVVNTIAWGNAPDQVVDFQTASTVSYSCIEGGWGGDGIGNTTIDPRFVDPTIGDYRIVSNSPCLDRGNAAALPPDLDDLDLDGNTSEPIPFDIEEHPRIMYGLVDVGAFESLAAFCSADLTGDDRVGFDDLVRLLALWGPCPGGCQADLDVDGTVGFGDLALLLPAWGPCVLP